MFWLRHWNYIIKYLNISETILYSFINDLPTCTSMATPEKKVYSAIPEVVSKQRSVRTKRLRLYQESIGGTKYLSIFWYAAFYIR